MTNNTELELQGYDRIPAGSHSDQGHQKSDNRCFHCFLFRIVIFKKTNY